MVILLIKSGWLIKIGFPRPFVVVGPCRLSFVGSYSYTPLLVSLPEYYYAPLILHSYVYCKRTVHHQLRRRGGIDRAQW